jgi:hypothetical protein
MFTPAPLDSISLHRNDAIIAQKLVGTKVNFYLRGITVVLPAGTQSNCGDTFDYHNI